MSVCVFLYKYTYIHFYINIHTHISTHVLYYNDRDLIRFICVYKPSNSDMSISLLLSRVLQSKITLVNVNKRTIIMGNLNLTKIDWLNLRTVLNNTNANKKLLLFSQRRGFFTS